MKLKIASDCQLDLSHLVDSRALINANSGGGKSYLMRLIAEQSAGHVQTLILDPEGEFATLRERFDFLLVGSTGEIPTEVRSAALLARKLLELQASAVIDLYDLKLPERRRFVRLFLESLMHLPKSHWHPLLIMLDEAHLFCPERSAGEAESTQAVIDLMSQGRKRSYCGILATQRLSKLHKDAEAETNNVFVGRTWLDIDQKRAGALLGMDKAAAQDLRGLDPGEFFAFGPAVSAKGIVRIKTDAVSTSHPKAGQRHKLTPPKPSDAVRRIVGALADLPQQADAEIRDLDAARKKIKDLEGLLRARPKDTEIQIAEKRVEIPVLKNGQLDRVEKLIERTEQSGQKLLAEAAEIRKTIQPAFGKPVAIIKDCKFVSTKPVQQLRQPNPSPTRALPVVTPLDGMTISKTQQRILDALAWYESLGNMEPTLTQIGAVALIDPTGGYFSNTVGPMTTGGLVDRGNGRMSLTDAGRELANTPESVGSLDEYHDVLRKRVRMMKSASGKTIEMLDVIIGQAGESITTEQIGQAISVDHTGGYFSNCIGPLSTAGLISRNAGVVKPTEVLFPRGL